MPVDIAAPCATQNERDADDGAALVANGVRIVAEGANMPSTIGAVETLRAGGVAFGPAKAANAGGVAVSGLEQTQNAVGMFLSADEIDDRLRTIMREIHRQCVEHAPDGAGPIDYATGANRAAFTKVACAMASFGIV